MVAIIGVMKWLVFIWLALAAPAALLVGAILGAHKPDEDEKQEAPESKVKNK